MSRRSRGLKAAVLRSGGTCGLPIAGKFSPDVGRDSPPSRSPDRIANADALLTGHSCWISAIWVEPLAEPFSELSRNLYLGGGYRTRPPGDAKHPCAAKAATVDCQ